MDQTTAQLRDEQQRRKQLQTQLNELQETNAELAAAGNAAETVADTMSGILLHICSTDNVTFVASELLGLAANYEHIYLHKAAQKI